MLQFYIMVYQQQMMAYQQYLQYIQYLQYQQYLYQLQLQYNQGRPIQGNYSPYGGAAPQTGDAQSYSPYAQYYGFQPPAAPRMPQQVNVVDFYKPPSRLALPSEAEGGDESPGDYTYQYDDDPAENTRGYTIGGESSGGPRWGAPLEIDREDVQPTETDIAPWPVVGHDRGAARRDDPLEGSAEGEGETMEADDVADAAPDDEMILEVMCYNCEYEIPVYTNERPLLITCPNCGTEGQIDE